MTKVVQIDGDYPDERVLSLEGLLALGHRAARASSRGPCRSGCTPYAGRGWPRSRTSPDGRRPLRGVRLSHAALTYHATAVAALGRLSDADLLYLPLPMTAVYAQAVLGRPARVRLPGGARGSRGPRGRLAGRWSGRRSWPRRRRCSSGVRAPIEDDQPRRPLRRRQALDKQLRPMSARRSATGCGSWSAPGAASTPGIADFFEAAGVTVVEAYGRAETGGAVAVALPEDAGSRTAGLPLPGTEVRISADGEILVSGPGLMDGYHGRRADGRRPGRARAGGAPVTPACSTPRAGCGCSAGTSARRTEAVTPGTLGLRLVGYPKVTRSTRLTTSDRRVPFPAPGETVPVTIDPSFVDHMVANVALQFLDRVDRSPRSEAFRYPDGRAVGVGDLGRGGGAGRRGCAAGLLALGLEPEQRVGIASGTRYEWILADLAVMCAAGATTTVYPSTNAEDTAYILGDSECRVVFAEDDEQIAKLKDHKAELPHLAKVVTFDGDRRTATG